MAPPLTHPFQAHVVDGQVYVDCAENETVAREIRDLLEVRPPQSPYQTYAPRPVRFWKQFGMEILVPRGLACEWFPEISQSCIRGGEAAAYGQLATTPLVFQAPAIRKIVQSFTSPTVESGQLTVEAPCGSGKTFMSLAVTQALGVRCAFLAHRSILLEQAESAYRRFLPDAPASGRVQGQRLDLQPFSVMSIMTLSAMYDRDFEAASFPPLADLWRGVGLVIVDESHHLPADTVKKILGTIPCRILFLSATPDYRSDGLAHVIQWYGGNKETIRAPSVQASVQVFHHVPATRRIMDRNNRLDNTATRRALSREPGLTERVVAQMERTLAQTKHVILFLTDFVEHVDTVLSLVDKDLPVKKYVGGEAKDYAPETRLFVGTHDFCKEGVDISIISMMVLFFPPSRNVEQTLGRLRPQLGGGAEREDCVVVEVRTGILSYRHLETYYKKKGWAVVRRSL